MLNGCLFVGPWRSSPCRLLDSEDAGEGGADHSSDHERGFGQEAETPGAQAEVEDPECEVAEEEERLDCRDCKDREGTPGPAKSTRSRKPASS